MDLQTWQLLYNIVIRYNGVTGEFTLENDKAKFASVITQKDFGGQPESVADMVEWVARHIYAAKPDGQMYQLFVDSFGQDCADDLMSYIRKQDSINALFAF